jgi:hypothetical protein
MACACDMPPERPIRRRTYALLLVVLAIVIASMALPRAVAFFEVRGSPTRVTEFLSALEAQVQNPADAGSFLGQLSGANYDVFGYVASGILLMMYVILRPVSAAFRVKRMIFNLYPDLEQLSSAPISLSVRGTMGLYALEEKLHRQIGARRPSEFPFDLLVATLLIPFS